MMAILDMVIFAGAFAAAASVFAFTLVPALPRIITLLRGEADPTQTSAPMLTLSDRRLPARVRPVPGAAIAVRPLEFRAAA